MWTVEVGDNLALVLLVVGIVWGVAWARRGGS
jgi:hypothetical protein